MEHPLLRSRAVLCLLPVFGVGLPAQHVVGPGGLPQISSALAIAAPGATIHVLPGVYQPFAVNIACTIRALSPGSVTILLAGTQAATTIAPPAGAVVHLAGLDFDAAGSVSPSTTSIVSISSGRVTLDECTITSTNAWVGPLVIQNATAHLQHCTVGANGAMGVHPGMRATNSQVTAIDSTFRGSPPTSLPHPTGQPGVDLSGSTFHASGCSIYSGVEFLARALNATGGQVWLSDSTVIASGCTIWSTGTAVVERCTLSSAPCMATSSENLLGVSRLNALQNGGTFDLTYHTIPNGYAAIFASQELATLTIPGLHAETQWLGGLGIINLGVVFADGLGHASASWAIPAGTWLIDQPLWFQGLTGFALPLQLSPVAGGVIR